MYSIISPIAITEALPKHSLYKVQEQELSIMGFTSISNFESEYGPKSRGIILYVRNGLTCVRKEIKVVFQEYIVADITLPTGKVVTLGVFYRSPNSTQGNNFRLLESIVEVANSTNPKVVILGDFNLPRINWLTCCAPFGSY